MKFHAQKQIGKSHVIDIENISLCIFQYLTRSLLYNKSVNHTVHVFIYSVFGVDK